MCPRPRTRVDLPTTTVKKKVISQKALAISLPPGLVTIRTKLLVLLQAAPIKLAVASQREPTTFLREGRAPILLIRHLNTAKNLINTPLASSLAMGTLSKSSAIKTARCCLPKRQRRTRWDPWRFWLSRRPSWPASRWRPLLLYSSNQRILIRCINQVLIRKLLRCVALKRLL